METFRRLFKVIATLAFLPVLAGCPVPGGVLRSLPPPLVHTPSITQQRPLPRPQPKPVVSPGPSLRGATIVIDPGHGGRHPGAWKGRGVLSRSPEKTLVLDIALKLRHILTQSGANVVMTRTSDVTVELEERAEIADRSRADLFVSIHMDSIHKPNISGTKVFMYTHASKQSQKAAIAMVRAFRNADIECRGFDREDFHVLREHSRPAILIECGFLTNRDESRMLNSDSYRSKLASAIADGIANYFSR